MKIKEGAIGQNCNGEFAPAIVFRALISMIESVAPPNIWIVDDVFGNHKVSSFISYDDFIIIPLPNHLRGRIFLRWDRKNSVLIVLIQVFPKPFRDPDFESLHNGSN